ncbi:MAG: Dabb family protein [Alphaproteobacteria bacterium]|jgi:hypothetical protein|nr:Dabb family protein [Alphaproteobacteria bacterium]MBT4084915.1 Dabb family protein [Alphaproteobacteria bacterium]MBT4542292.1 Dabb family protein [Alphaproteobacteria bacterium]MBT7746131.1 Dabb family protein [Alphaproteobacteria bacterium]
MIRHCVFLKFRDDVSDSDKQAIYDKLNRLRDHLSGVVDASFGANVSPEGRGRGFEDGFTMDFADASARDHYLEDPEHRKVGSKMVTMLAGGRDEGLLVFDLEV